MPIEPRGGISTLFDIPVGRWTTRELTEVVCARAAAAQPLFVTYVNAHNINVAARDEHYARALREADIVYADGMAVVWASRWLDSRHPLPERVNAGDFFPGFCSECARRGLSLYLLGSEPGVARRCADRMRRHAPDLKIAGASDGFWGRGGEFADERAALRAIRESGARILLAGMGVPRQELWARARAADLGVPVVWCVGALFEYYAGQRARAPVWMRRAGLEWAFRLALEPRRMARRYLIGNAEFLWRTAREWRRKS